MRRLFIADVHATLPALDAVLEQAGSTDAVYCLGDLVGYGPHPAECLDRLMAIGARGVLGNHDREMLHPPPPLPSSPDGHQIWLHWTYDELASRHKRYLAQLPERIELTIGGRSATLAHGHHRGLLIHPNMPDEMIAAALEGIPGEVVLFGHCHCCVERDIAGRHYVGVKAVGQARQHDPWAGYAIEQDGHITHHVVRYDQTGVIRDLDRIGLPSAFQQRWERYLLSGYDPEWSRPWPARED